MLLSGGVTPSGMKIASYKKSSKSGYSLGVMALMFIFCLFCVLLILEKETTEKAQEHEC